MASVTVSFTLDTERDASLLGRLMQFKRRDRSVAIRDALHRAWEPGAGDIEGIEAIVRRAIHEELAGRLVAAGPGVVNESSEEPEEAAANLDGLVNRLQNWRQGGGEL